MTELPTSEVEPDRPPERRQRSPGELVVDLVLVAGIGVYLYLAQSYPADGRQIPTVVGVVGLVASVIQLAGWFVRPLWTFTHGNPPARTDIPAGRPEPAVTAPAVTAKATAAESGEPPNHQSRDTLIIMGWAAGFLGAILAVGYEYGVPLFFLAYFLSRRSWKAAVVSAIVMWALTRFVFMGVLAVPLPSGAFFS